MSSARRSIGAPVEPITSPTLLGPLGRRCRLPWSALAGPGSRAKRTTRMTIWAYSSAVVEVAIPNQLELMWPTLQALKRLGGSGRIDEIVEAVIDAEGFTEAQQEVRRRPGDRMSRIEYNLAWGAERT